MMSREKKTVENIKLRDFVLGVQRPFVFLTFFTSVNGEDSAHRFDINVNCKHTVTSTGVVIH